MRKQGIERERVRESVSEGTRDKEREHEERESK